MRWQNITGSGKTYLACAFGMEALKQYFSVKFVRLPDMLLALETAREEKNYPKFFPNSSGLLCLSLMSGCL